MINLIFMGAPGAGKGTQAEIACKDLGIVQLSTGEILRETLKKETELGIEVKYYMNKGDLVPDSVVVSIIKARLMGNDCAKGFILDGFPRSKGQAQALDEILNEMNKNIDHVFFFNVPDEKLIDRLLKRAGKERRTDDNLESIQNRLKYLKRKQCLF